ncbi:MAG: hypothetical protein LBS97_06840 [Treponema sp.]|jgi:KaiC/GvpD/RAD55 family RecA-like ATPase|nr:hypothetical protein [Treponema sp.]
MAHELYAKSPVRLFEKAAGGVLSAGEIGLITSKKGLGKTAVLVQFGIDSLLDDKEVVHVSFNQQTSNVITWYQDMFAEFAKKKNVAAPGEILNDLVRKRIILNLNQEVALHKMIATIKALAESGIKTSALFIDDLEPAKATIEDLKALKEFAKEAGITVWISSANESADLADNLPGDLDSLFDAALHLNPRPDGIELQILKFRDAKKRDSQLYLDSKTLLIVVKS